ncbi:hypothetical protein GmRootV116_22380 [Variovorax sp. V116]
MCHQRAHSPTGKPLDDIEHLRQSAADILGMPIDSRLMRRTYGSQFPELIDQPDNGATRERARSAVAGALMQPAPLARATLRGHAAWPGGARSRGKTPSTGTAADRPPEAGTDNHHRLSTQRPRGLHEPREAAMGSCEPSHSGWMHDAIKRPPYTTSGPPAEMPAFAPAHPLGDQTMRAMVRSVGCSPKRRVALLRDADGPARAAHRRRSQDLDQPLLHLWRPSAATASPDSCKGWPASVCCS